MKAAAVFQLFVDCIPAIVLIVAWLFVRAMRREM
jgi:hypothetical protein